MRGVRLALAGARGVAQKAVNVALEGIFLNDHANARTYAAGERVFDVDDVADCMYVVMSGAVEIQLQDKVLERVSTGGIFGEMALIEELPRSATAIAVQETRLNKVDKKHFLFLLRQHPEFALQVMEVLAHRVRRMDAILRQNAAKA